MVIENVFDVILIAWMVLQFPVGVLVGKSIRY